MSTSPSILVTGASGFLGSAVVRIGREEGSRVIGTSRRGAGPDHVAADVLDGPQLVAVLSGLDTLIHTAGLVHKKLGQAHPDDFRRTNVDGTASVMSAAAKAGVRRAVLVSSVSVYGRSGDVQCDEESVCRPDGAYSRSKYEAEKVAQRIAATAGMELTILRMATIYGEGDPGNVGRLLRALDQGRFVWIGSGTNRKSLVYREDAARACVVAARRLDAAPGVFNVSAPPVTMKEVVNELIVALGRSTLPVRIPARLGLLAAKIVDTGRAGRTYEAVSKWLSDEVFEANRIRPALSWQPEVSLRQGLRRQVDWYRGRSSAEP